MYTLPPLTTLTDTLFLYTTRFRSLVRFPIGPFRAPQCAFGFLEWRRFLEQNHPCAAPAERGRPLLLILRLLPPRASPTAQTFKPPAGEQETAPRPSHVGAALAFLAG